MQTKSKVYQVAPAKQSDYAAQQRVRVAAQQKAEIDREQRRREMDARLDVNAGKWRYSCDGK